MTVLWPVALLALLVVPAAIAYYVWLERRRRRQAVRFTDLALVRAAAPRRPPWKRHVPFGLLLTAIALLALAAARPQVSAEIPVARSAVIMALDVSGSMCATDVEPNRMAAAQDAVRDFITKQDSSTRIGLVVFSGFAQVAVAPTQDREALLRAVDGLTIGRGTTIGAAILKAVDTIAEIDANVAPTGSGVTPLRPREPGTYAPEIVVLLTDGANTRGISPQEAAEAAAERGVRVYPIGFGTRNPTSMMCTPAQLGANGSDGWFGGFTGGAGGYLVADETTLRQVAETTGGEYFAAGDAGELQNVLDDLPQTVATQREDVEVSAFLVGAAVLALLGAVWAAARWTAFP
ncbi:Ca-activated chloride channel family protein [Pseudonocardia thermophila]|jgi:Mg-chelatase subunit ChlD|uniref:Ca-activated chloride channel family protein n=2 Tax=Pseudonocardia thermophila TaxID=1848 RepID=A0A1M6WX15_PSETH|nr:VWA domain-containing protein [Pseudonocardia thermophila]SHK98233.1 Ca-activated chloride channel family protein [Pseudonocardia thermophila]